MFCNMLAENRRPSGDNHPCPGYTSIRMARLPGAIRRCVRTETRTRPRAGGSVRVVESEAARAPVPIPRKSFSLRKSSVRRVLPKGFCVLHCVLADADAG